MIYVHFYFSLEEDCQEIANVKLTVKDSFTSLRHILKVTNKLLLSTFELEGSMSSVDICKNLLRQSVEVQVHNDIIQDMHKYEM